MPIHLEHVWHPDDGFRLAEIRNKAIAEARGEYLIFLDGDCVPQPDFVAQHRALAERGTMVTGSRILIGRSLTHLVVKNKVSLYGRSLVFWLAQRIKGETNKLLPLFVKLPRWPRRPERSFKWRGIKGCNMAAWANDVAIVNGFDESYMGWGHEDADFVVRLHNAGIRRKKGFMATEVLHLWHEEAPRDRADRNRQRVLQCLSDRRIAAQTGLAQTLAKARSDADAVVAA
ncbi:glycosyl transferase family 2 [Paraburkholderia caballeronis]|nr:glycosyl transferase family 2 [Paraburkholderia caballeronis]